MAVMLPDRATGAASTRDVKRYDDEMTVLAGRIGKKGHLCQAGIGHPLRYPRYRMLQRYAQRIECTAPKLQ